LVDVIVAALSAVIGAPTLFETEMVLASREGASGLAALALFFVRNEVMVVPFDDRHRRLATAAFVHYGKGRHPAALNYGDCMTYATARLCGAPLLFVGEDFAKTDLPAALT
jgi:ribonuclease VapC